MTFDYVEEISEPSYAPLIGKAEALVIRTQPLSAETVGGPTGSGSCRATAWATTRSTSPR